MFANCRKKAYDGEKSTFACGSSGLAALVSLVFSFLKFKSATK